MVEGSQAFLTLEVDGIIKWFETLDSNHFIEFVKENLDNDDHNTYIDFFIILNFLRYAGNITRLH